MDTTRSLARRDRHHWGPMSLRICQSCESLPKYARSVGLIRSFFRCQKLLATAAFSLTLRSVLFVSA